MRCWARFWVFAADKGLIGAIAPKVRLQAIADIGGDAIPIKMSDMNSFRVYAQKNPAIVGVVMAGLMLVGLPTLLWVKGYPVALLLTGAMLPKVLGAALAFGLVMALFVWIWPKVWRRGASVSSPYREILAAVFFGAALYFLFFV